MSIAAACGGGDSPSEPQLDPGQDLTALDVTPDSTSVVVDGAVQFEAAGTTDPAYRTYWWKGNRLARLDVAPGWIKLAPGTARTFKATAVTSSGSTIRVSLQWKATGGSINQEGKYVAGKRPGRYVVVATSGSVVDTARVVIEDGAAAERKVSLSPATTTLAPGAQQRFGFSGSSSDGSSFAVEPRYTATGGTVSAAGTYTAGDRAGTYRLIATDQGTGLADTATITIKGEQQQPDDQTVASVSVTPATVSLSKGDKKQLAAQARTADGGTIKDATFEWTTSNAAIATVASNGMVSGLKAGEVVITATSGGKSDRSTITVDEPQTPTEPPPPPPPPSGGEGFAGCPSSGYSRLVSVSSSSQLSSAINSAQPGDQIRLAAGTYSGTRDITRSGTQSQPIVLCGPRSAVLTGDTRLKNVDWWVLQGFTVRDGFQPIYAVGSNHNRVQGLEIYNTGQEAIHFRCSSSDNVVQENWIHDTGRSTPQYGEAVYLGTDQTQWSSFCGSSGPDRSDRNHVIDNKFGPNVRGDHIDIKEGTTGGVIRGNTFDGTGTALINGMVYDWITVKGNGYTIENNRGSKAPRDGIWGFVKVQGWGNDNVYRGNVFDVQASGYGIRSDGGSGNIVYCNNVVTNAGAGRTNVSCR